MEKNILTRLMTTEEAAELWGVSLNTVKTLCQAGKVNARKMGKTWVLDKLQPKPLIGEQVKKMQPREWKDSVKVCDGCGKISTFMLLNEGEDPERYICTHCMATVETARRKEHTK